MLKSDINESTNKQQKNNNPIRETRFIIFQPIPTITKITHITVN